MRLMNSKRIRSLKKVHGGRGPVLYWMQRDQRVLDNWALLFAQDFANLKKQPLCVLFNIVPDYLGANDRHYSFMTGGLSKLSGKLKEYNIAFMVTEGDPSDNIEKMIEKYRVSALVCDFNPLRIKRQWKAELENRIDIPFFEVDAHNIVPCWTSSEKQEYGAYTIRPKIKRALPEFLTAFPEIERHKYSINLDEDESLLHKARNVQVKAGEDIALALVRNFIDKRLGNYHLYKNDPNKDATSGLSACLHFGQLSAQRTALEVNQSGADLEAKEAFLEELIVRRELSDNFCFYNTFYDSLQGLPRWAIQTLERHAGDKREYLYTLSEFERAGTHDDLWNAAQNEMMQKGSMHGYMRMYWAKKILEWTESPRQAMNICISLNDRYENDGRDPNGYAGCLWAVGGLHDRPWKERDVFGQIRYMNRSGCERKFDVQEYIRKNKVPG